MFKTHRKALSVLLTLSMLVSNVSPTFAEVIGQESVTKAILKNGTEVNRLLKSFANENASADTIDASIAAIGMSTEVPEDAINIAQDGSVPVYAWLEEEETAEVADIISNTVEETMSDAAENIVWDITGDNLAASTENGMSVISMANEPRTLYLYSSAPIAYPEDASYMFSNMTELQDISGLRTIDFSSVIDATGMFQNDAKLTNLEPVSSYNTENLLYGNAFNGCPASTWEVKVATDAEDVTTVIPSTDSGAEEIPEVVFENTDAEDAEEKEIENGEQESEQLAQELEQNEQETSLIDTAEDEKETEVALDESEPETATELTEEEIRIMSDLMLSDAEAVEEETESTTELVEAVEEEEDDFVDESGLDFSSKRLLVATDEVIEENVLDSYNGFYLLQFDTELETAKAYAKYIQTAEFVDVDSKISAAEGLVEIAEMQEMSENENPVSAMKDALNTPVSMQDHVIAIIDTGATQDVERVSMLDDDGTDVNGHGTKMIDTILSVEPNAKILSIKALDDNATGNISAVYTAIKYAIERDVDVIDLSLYGYATKENSAIASIIREAVAKGIKVVGAAGNDGRNVKYYIPGNVEEAIIVGACDTNGQRILSSNYGETVDYYVQADSTSEAAAKAAAYLLNHDDMADFMTVDETVYDGEINNVFTFVKASNPDVTAAENVVGQTAYSIPVSLENGELKATINPDPATISLEDVIPVTVFIDWMNIGKTERKITEECSYDAETGILTIPGAYKDENITVVSVIKDDAALASILPGVNENGELYAAQKGHSLFYPTKWGVPPEPKWNSVNDQTANGVYDVWSLPIGTVFQIKGGKAREAKQSELFGGKFRQWAREEFGFGIDLNDVRDANGNHVDVFENMDEVFNYCIDPENDMTGRPTVDGGIIKIEKSVTLPNGQHVIVCWMAVEDYNHQNSGEYIILRMTPGRIRVQKASSNTAITSGEGSSHYKYNATFALYNSNGKQVATIETKNDGYSNWIGHLIPDTYTLKEIKAPAGFKLNTQAMNVKVIANGNTTVKFVNEPYRKGRIQIEKLDVVTKEHLKDAEFTVYEKNGDGWRTIDTLTSKNNYLSDWLYETKQNENKFLVLETKKPQNYSGEFKEYFSLTKKVKPFKYNYKATNIGTYTVEVIKRDKNNKTKYLSGAKFDLYQKNGDGYERVSALTEKTSNGKPFYTVQVQANATNHGDFLIKETKAPEGYELDPTAHKFSIKKGFPHTASTDPFKNKYRINIDNTQITVPVEVEVIKKDPKGNLIEGAAFTIFEYNASLNNGNGGYSTKGLPLKWDATSKTYKRTGLTISFTGNNRNNGKFLIKETKAAPGYIFNGAQKEVTFENIKTKQTKSVTFTNTPNEYYIEKYAADAKTVIDAAFLLKSEKTQKLIANGKEITVTPDGKEIETVNGVIKLEKIPDGVYSFKETRSITPGYNLNPSTYAFKVTKGKVAGGTHKKVINTQSFDLFVIKNDESNEKKNGFPQGVEFTIFRYDPETKTYPSPYDRKLIWDTYAENPDGGYGAFVDKETNEVPKYTYDESCEGKYRIVETATTEGYILDREAKLFTVPKTTTGERVIRVSFTNKPNEFVLKKVDKQGNPLEGVEFEFGTGSDTYTRKTDADGLIKLTALKPGNWHYKETNTLQGYALDKNTYAFRVEKDGKITVNGKTAASGQVVMENSENYLVKIVKKDAVSGQELDYTTGFPRGTTFAIHEFDKNLGAEGGYRQEVYRYITYMEASDPNFPKTKEGAYTYKITWQTNGGVANWTAPANTNGTNYNNDSGTNETSVVWIDRETTSYYARTANGSRWHYSWNKTKSSSDIAGDNESGGAIKPTYTRTGYQFSKWKLKSVSGGVVKTNHSNGTVIPVGTLLSNGERGDLVMNSGSNSMDVVYEAQWTPNTYKIKYNANGGTGTMDDTNMTYNVAKALTANDFKKTGYTFAGWATSASGKAVYTNKQSVSNLTATNNGTVTLYAVWTPITYKIKYNANGGTGTMADTNMTYNVAKALTTNNFKKTGHTFAGWATSATGKVVYANRQSVSNLTTTNNGTVTLYAVWTPLTYKIAYNANGGTGAPGAQTKTYGTDLTLTSTKPTKTKSYTVKFNANGGNSTGVAGNQMTAKSTFPFKNWNTKADGSGKSYASGGKYTANVAATLYAQWGDEQKQTIKLPTPDGALGKVFLGWYSADGRLIGKAGASYAVFSNPTLYAHWGDANSLTVHFYGNGATKDTVHTDIQITSKPLPYYLQAGGAEEYSLVCYYQDNVVKACHNDEIGFTINTLPKYKNGYWSLERPGYSTSGKWAVGSPDSDVVIDAGIAFSNYNEVINALGTAYDYKNDSKSVSLYAIWEQNAFTITYDYDGGTATNPTEYTSSTPTFTLQKPTKENAVFAGWEDVDSGVTYSNVTITKGSSGNRHFKAHWMEAGIFVDDETKTLAELSQTNSNMGKFMIEELTSTPGYIRDKSQKEFTLSDAVDEDGRKVIKIEFENVPNTVPIKKVDRDDNPVKDIQFTVWLDEADLANYADNEYVQRNAAEKTYTTDANGLITLEKLAPGTWHYKEVPESAEAKGLIPDTNTYDIHVDKDGNIVNADIMRVVSNITKKDFEIYKIDEYGNPIPDIAFDITDPNDNTTTEYTDENGRILLTDLDLGTYSFKESAIQNVDGIVIDSTTYTFTVTAEGVTGNNKAVVKNKINEIVIIKKDESGNNLQGAEFHVWSDEDDYTFITDEDGQIAEMGFASGTWHIQETKAPERYMISDPSIKDFVVNENGLIQTENGETDRAEFEFIDEPVSIPLIKVDENGERVDAVFHVWNHDTGYDEVLNTNNGEAFVERILPGRYEFEEISGPSGYLANRKGYFIFNENGTVSVPSGMVANDEFKYELNDYTCTVDGYDFNITIDELVLENDTVYAKANLSSSERFAVSPYGSLTTETKELLIPLTNGVGNKDIYIYTEDGEEIASVSAEVDYTRDMTALDEDELAILIENKPNSLSLLKIGLNNTVLEDVLFRFGFEPSGSGTGSITDGAEYRTNEDGMLVINGKTEVEKLAAGTYTVTEIENPNTQYRPDTRPRTFVVDEQGVPFSTDPDVVCENGKIEITIKNEILTGKHVYIRKFDAETGEQLTGDEFKFEIREWNGTEYVSVGNESHFVESDKDEQVVNRYEFNSELFKTAENEGKFLAVELEAAEGYIGGWQQEFTYDDMDDEYYLDADNTPNSIDIRKVDENGNAVDAVFEIWQDENEKETLETVDGVTSKLALADGTWYFSEKEAPEGHMPDIDENGNMHVYSFVVENGLIRKDNELIEHAEFTVTNYSLVPVEVEIEKVDKNNNILENVVFEIHEFSKETGDFKEDVVSGMQFDEDSQTFKSSELNVTEDNLGKFKIVETETEEGLVPDFTAIIQADWTKTADYTKEVEVNGASKQIQVTVGESHIFHFTGENKVVNTGNKLRVEKVDDEGNPMDGVEFTLREDYEEEPEGDGQDGRILTNGEVEKEEHFFQTLITENGLAEVEDLPDGKYILAETKGIDGYAIDTTQHKLTVEDGYIYEDDVATKDYVYTVRVANIPNKLIILKTTKDGEPIEGVKFELRRYEDFDSDKDSEPLEAPISGYTGADGKLEFNKLKDGVWYLRETEVPDGITLCTEDRQFVVNDGRFYNMYGESLSATPVFEWTIWNDNEFDVTIKIEKVDEDTRERLTGAAFSVYEKDPASVANPSEEYKVLDITDDDGDGIYYGTMKATQANQGKFFIKETKAPENHFGNWSTWIDGYEKRDWTFEMENAVTNKQTPQFDIKKVDANTGKPLSGCVIKIWSDTDPTETEYTTNEDGLIEIKNPTLGTTYHFKEIKAPRGYLLDNSTHDIEVDATGYIYGQSHFVYTFENTPRFDLPTLFAGGIGRTGLYVLGGLMATMLLIIAFIRKRKIAK